MHKDHPFNVCNLQNSRVKKKFNKKFNKKLA